MHRLNPTYSTFKCHSILYPLSLMPIDRLMAADSSPPPHSHPLFSYQATGCISTTFNG
jgi:hypothetical protein